MDFELDFIMTYFHCRTRIQIRTQTWIPTPVATLYYAEHVPNGHTWTRIWIWIPFPNGYYTHFRDGSPFQGQISIPITYILIRGSESESKPIEKSGIVQESVSESESESEYGNRNKP